MNAIKRWWMRHKDRKQIKMALEMAEMFLPVVSENVKNDIVRCVVDLLDDYHNNWDIDKFIHGCWKRFYIVYEVSK